MPANKTSTLAQGFKVVGAVTSDGLVEVKGEVEGSLDCTSLAIAETAVVNGTLRAEHVVVDGAIEGTIFGGDVVLKGRARVFGDIVCFSITVGKGALLEGRLIRARSKPTATTRSLGSGAAVAEGTRATIDQTLDGKEVLFASLIGLALISLLTWFIAG